MATETEKLLLVAELHSQMKQAGLTAIKLNLLIAEETGSKGFPPTAIIGTLADMAVTVAQEFGDQMEGMEKEDAENAD